MGVVIVAGCLVGIRRQLIAVGRTLISVRVRLIAVGGGLSSVCGRLISVGAGLSSVRGRLISVRAGLSTICSRATRFAGLSVREHSIPLPSGAQGRFDPRCCSIVSVNRTRVSMKIRGNGLINMCSCREGAVCRGQADADRVRVVVVDRAVRGPWRLVAAGE
jgi:hypothetical protein